MATELGVLASALRNSAAAQAMIDAGGADAATYGARLAELIGAGGGSGTIATAANLWAFDTGFKVVTPEGLEDAAETVDVAIVAHEVAIDGHDFWNGAVDCAGEATVTIVSAANLNGWPRTLEFFANGQITTIAAVGIFDQGDSNFPLVIPDGERRTLILTQDGADTIAKILGASTERSAADASGVNTGTSTTTDVTPDALAGSYAGTACVELEVFPATVDVTTGDGKAYFVVPAAMNGMNLVSANMRVITAGTTNNLDVQIRNVTDTQDMLTTKIRVETTEVSSSTGVTGVVDAAHDDVATHDLLAVDVDAVQTTAPKGLIVYLEFRLP